MTFPLITEHPAVEPIYLSAESFGDQTKVAFLGDFKRFPSYPSPQSYEADLSFLVQGALVALGWEPGGRLVATMNPHPSPWVEWLLSMWGWNPEADPEEDWDDLDVMYARHFTEGILHHGYSGACQLDPSGDAVLFCAECVTRNKAPYSWVIHSPVTATAVYFHNTMSFGLAARSSDQLKGALSRLEAIPAITLIARKGHG